MRKRKLKSSQTPKKPRLDLSGVIDAQTAFSCRLLKELTATSADSLVCSPFSVAACLAIVFAGAGGSTKAELRKLLGIDASDDQIHQYFSVLLRAIARTNKKFKLDAGNKLCVKEGGSLQSEFEDVVKEYYQGELERFNCGDRKSICQRLNAWVSELTHGLIPSIIEKSDITPRTALILVNAVYFNGVWVNQFDELWSEEKDFRVDSGVTRKVRMMRQQGEFSYHENKDFKAIRFPYEGGQLAMYVFLPKRFKAIGSIFNGFTESKLKSVLQKLRTAGGVKVKVEFPCFEVRSTHKMKDALQAMALSAAFNCEAADFSRLLDCPEPLFIDEVLQKAYIKTNEKGTEAAAATRVHVVTKACLDLRKEFAFKADHPFFYFVIHESKMSVLFAGTFT